MTPSPYVRGIRRRIGSTLLLLPSVALVIRDRRGRILFVQSAEDGSWGLPAGGIEPGETPLQAARRELEEETGVVGTTLTLLAACGGSEFRHTYQNGDQVEYTVFVFGGDLSQPAELKPRDEEVLRARLFARDEAPTLSLPYPRELLWVSERTS